MTAPAVLQARLRPVHVYRLEIAYPDGSRVPGWQPAGWPLGSLPRRTRRTMTRAGFRWPAERMFLSPAGAYDRARLLRAYGAEVTVHRSAPVTWPGPRPVLSLSDACRSGPAGEYPQFDLCGIPLDGAR